MAIPYNVLSWNIQNLGSSKTGLKQQKKKSTRPAPKSKNEFFILEIIQQIITYSNANIVAIMEVQSNQGDTIGKQLANNLNAATAGANWLYNVSLRQQDESRQEEYVYLWQNPTTSPITLDTTVNAGPTFWVGMLDQNAIANLFTRLTLSTADQANLLTTLASAAIGVLNPTKANANVYRINITKWIALQAAGTNQASVGAILNFATCGFPNIAALTQAQLVMIAQTIVETDVILFPTVTERAPFVASFQVNSKPVRIAVHHTPGPTGGVKKVSASGTANNAVALAQAVQPANATNMLYMGDLNVSLDAITAKQPASTYKVVLDNNIGVFQKQAVGSNQTVFAPITGAPLNTVTRQLSTKTTVSKQAKNITSVLSDVLVSEFDSFYFRGSTITATNPTILQLIQRINSTTPAGTNSLADPNYEATLAQKVVKYFRIRFGVSFFDKQLKLANKKINDAKKQQTQLTANKATASTNASNGNSGTGTSLGKRKRTTTSAVKSNKKKKVDATQELKALQALQVSYANPKNVVPLSISDSAYFFAQGLSDHLPISITLNS